MGRYTKFSTFTFYNTRRICTNRVGRGWGSGPGKGHGGNRPRTTFLPPTNLFHNFLSLFATDVPRNVTDGGANIHAFEY